jgi:uncharacterized membrane protein YcaP (DUF421 family)
MTREELIAMGVSDENADKIMADYGSSIQKANAKANEYKAKAGTADELQKKLDELEAGQLTEVEKANKALEAANEQIAKLQKDNAIRDQREAAMTNFKITAEQAKTVVKDDGSLDYESLGKIMSDKETAAAQAKEQEIAKNQDVPGGGSAGGKDKDKTADVENAEKITFGNPASNSEAKNSYVI